LDRFRLDEKENGWDEGSGWDKLKNWVVYEGIERMG